MSAGRTGRQRSDSQRIEIAERELQTPVHNQMRPYQQALADVVEALRRAALIEMNNLRG